MPANKDYKTRRAEMSGEDVKDGLCRGLGLLALPVLAFQRNMLGILRTGIEQAGLLKPLQTLIENELHAAMMIADPTGERRNSLGADMEKTLKDALDKAVPKVISGSISFIDAQEALLTSLIGALDTARKNSSPKTSRSRTTE
jgi:hypothetical protein